MWLKLGNEHLNLDHVVRVRFNKGWKNGQEELVAEVESFAKGEVQVFTRYRQREAEILQAFLQNRAMPVEVPVPVPVPVPSPREGPTPVVAASPATTNTLHEI